MDGRPVSDMFSLVNTVPSTSVQFINTKRGNKYWNSHVDETKEEGGGGELSAEIVKLISQRKLINE